MRYDRAKSRAKSRSQTLVRRRCWNRTRHTDREFLPRGKILSSRPIRSTITYHTQLAHSPWFATTHQIPNNRHRRTHERLVHSFPRYGCALETIEIRCSRGQCRSVRGGTPRNGDVAFTTVCEGSLHSSARRLFVRNCTKPKKGTPSCRVVSYSVASFRRVRSGTPTGDSGRHAEISLALRLRSLANAVTRYHRDRSNDGD